MEELYEVVTYYNRRNKGKRFNREDKGLKEKEIHEKG
jgi:hypothetical protein